MTVSAENVWTIDELGARVALALAVGYEGQNNGRVRDVPDRRTIRYYTTLGLIDRPAEMRGRTALYGRRHLLQLVAIKRLQARGLSLAELQTRLLGRSSGELEKLARLPDSPAADRPAPPDESRRREPFWSAAPAPVAPADADANVAEPAPVVMQGVRLSADVSLMLEAARPLDNDDLEAIRVVAEPLLKLLARRRLLPAHPEGE